MHVVINLSSQQGVGTLAQRKALLDAIYSVVGHSTSVSNALTTLGATISDVSFASRTYGNVGDDVHATKPPSFPPNNDVSYS